MTTLVTLCDDEFGSNPVSSYTPRARSATYGVTLSISTMCLVLSEVSPYFSSLLSKSFVFELSTVDTCRCVCASFNLIHFPSTYLVVEIGMCNHVYDH